MSATPYASAGKVHGRRAANGDYFKHQISSFVDTGVPRWAATGDLGMSWTYEIALRGPAQPDAGSPLDLVAAVQTWFVAGPRHTLAMLAGLAGLDLYMPAQ